MNMKVTPPGVSSTGITGADELGNLTEKYSTITALNAKNTFKSCIVCGSRFTPKRNNHSLCKQCWSYDQVGRAIESIRHLMAGVV